METGERRWEKEMVGESPNNRKEGTLLTAYSCQVLCKMASLILCPLAIMSPILKVKRLRFHGIKKAK